MLAPPPDALATAPLSSGEVNFLWWFIQGSIMDADVRARLRAGWGLCDRHTAAWLAVESAFRHRYLHGPAVFYDDLMQHALRAFDRAGAIAARGIAQRVLARRLRSRGACHLCELGLGPDSPGYVPGQRLQTGRDTSPLRAFMQETAAFWGDQVCGICAGNAHTARCRAHLCAELDAGAEIEPHRALVRVLSDHMKHYDDSFRWEKRGSDTVQDRAALIGAAGWSGGWRALLAVYGDPPAGHATS
jgi:hypothetical protein